MTVTGVDGVSVSYPDGTIALQELTVLASHGELLAVIGPSGSGKSTLLKAMAGLIGVRAGEVVIDNEPVTSRPTEQRDVAMVFEYDALMPFLNVAENLGFGLTVRHTPRPEIEARVTEQARRLRITRLLGRKPAALSAGEHGQVGIGRAMMRVPAVFLLDEPLAHHDAGDRLQMRQQIVRTVKTLGVTTFYVTHDRSEALAIGDRIAVLRSGGLAQLAPPRVVYTQPADIFVADFIGAAPLGLLPARVVTAGDQAAFQVAARTLPLWGPVPPDLRRYVGRDVVLGFREEDVQDATLDLDPHAVTLPGTIACAEYTGSHAIVSIDVAVPHVVRPGDGRPSGPASAQLRARFPGRSVVRPGAPVVVNVNAARAHVFDAATGRAVHHPVPR
jgi:multiple sugar transport system ATP-binding protein